jgi:hypothetical protein
MRPTGRCKKDPGAVGRQNMTPSGPDGGKVGPDFATGAAKRPTSMALFASADACVIGEARLI